jgi:hypothetical protein
LDETQLEEEMCQLQFDIVGLEELIEKKKVELDKKKSLLSRDRELLEIKKG